MTKPIGNIVLVVFLATITAQAQEGNRSIVGCIEVGCPPATRITWDNCTVVDRSFPNIGVTRISATSEALAELSWSKGFNVDDGRLFHSSYYLGTPPALDLSNTGACALFFHGVSEDLSFGGISDELADGTCSQAMGSACVDALTARARKFDFIDDDDDDDDDRVSPQERCEKLREDFEKNMDDACRQVSTGFWKNLTAVGKWA